MFAKVTGQSTSELVKYNRDDFYHLDSTHLKKGREPKYIWMRSYTNIFWPLMSDHSKYLGYLIIIE